MKNRHNTSTLRRRRSRYKKYSSMISSYGCNCRINLFLSLAHMLFIIKYLNAILHQLLRVRMNTIPTKRETFYFIKECYTLISLKIMWPQKLTWITIMTLQIIKITYKMLKAFLPKGKFVTQKSDATCKFFSISFHGFARV